MAKRLVPTCFKQQQFSLPFWFFFFFPEQSLKRCSLLCINKELYYSLDETDLAPAEGGDCGSQGREDSPVTEVLVVHVSAPSKSLLCSCAGH